MGEGWDEGAASRVPPTFPREAPRPHPNPLPHAGEGVPSYFAKPSTWKAMRGSTIAASGVRLALRSTTAFPGTTHQR
jgi:hypothetical protein